MAREFTTRRSAGEQEETLEKTPSAQRQTSRFLSQEFHALSSFALCVFARGLLPRLDLRPSWESHRLIRWISSDGCSLYMYVSALSWEVTKEVSHERDPPQP